MKKKIIIGITVMLAAGTLCGCGADLTDSERKLIAEYAADTLLKYDKNYNIKYEAEETDETDTAVESVTAKITEQPPVETPQATIGQEEKKSETTPTPQVSQTPEVTQAPETTKANAQTSDAITPVEQIKADEQSADKKSPLEVGKMFGLDGVEIGYQGMECDASYPQSQSEELNFKVDATSGCKLVVLKFEMFNVSDTAKTCNIVGQNIKFRLCFNGTDLVSVQKTLLLNDLANTNTVLQPGEKKNVVVLAQVQDGYESSISSIDMTIRVSGENFTIKLQ